YLQVLPGVIFTGDQGGQLYIRGGSPIQNKVLLDGMVIYNPFHSIGLFSVFETDIIRNADIFTGGFGAEFGGRISSIMNITTRDGNRSRFAGKFGVNTFGSNLLVEGPIGKKNTNNMSSTSFIATIKKSYLKESSKIFYNYIDTGGLPFNYTDLYGKLSLNASNGSKINLFGFSFNDNVSYRDFSDFEWHNSGVGTNFILIPESSSTLIKGNFAYSNYLISLTESNLPPRTSEINGFNLGLNFTYFLVDDEINYGIEMLGFQTVFDFFNSVNRKIIQKQNTTELAGYVKYKKTIGNLLLEPSFRAHYYASLSTFSPEPRLAAKYNINERLRLKLAGGFYSQNLISATSDRDVVNLFYGFLSGPDNLPATFDGKEVTHKLQKSKHLIFGVEVDLFKSLNLNIEGYYKDFPQLTIINRDKVFDDTGDNWEIPDRLKKDFIIETGTATGFDISAKYELRNLYFWGVYSLSYINRFDGINEYVPHYDRRHNMNFVGSYVWGPQKAWDLSLRWNLGSGFPFTKTQGYFENLDFSDGINTNITEVNGTLGVLYADYNTGRLPYYHRLDISIKRKFELSKNANLEVNLGITNVYNRKNIFYFDRIKHERINQLPFMPSLGMFLSF
ncbi:MAG: TonB-dependent receptor plug domain-containing protein, partial [Bacteroidales bacterium]|nr:TonB-dependent receptor plug domain-containing protein [Bacteroidales bacterium]